MKRIVNGNTLSNEEYPWYCWLTVGCGGTLIHCDYKNNYGIVLTAAHCLYQFKHRIAKDGTFDNYDNLQCRFNILNNLQPHKDTNAVSLYIKEIHLHPEYAIQSTSTLNDVAIVIIHIDDGQSIPNINANNLPKICNISLENAPDVCVIGCGLQKHIYQEITAEGNVIIKVDGDDIYPKQLQGIYNMKVMNTDIFNEHYNLSNQIDTTGLLPLIHKDKDKTSAPGDSGGPALIQINNKWYILGICSYKLSYFDFNDITKPIQITNASVPVIYQKVYNYADIVNKYLNVRSNDYSKLFVSSQIEDPLKKLSLYSTVDNNLKYNVNVMKELISYYESYDLLNVSSNTNYLFMIISVTIKTFWDIFTKSDEKGLQLNKISEHILLSAKISYLTSIVFNICVTASVIYPSLLQYHEYIKGFIQISTVIFQVYSTEIIVNSSTYIVYILTRLASFVKILVAYFNLTDKSDTKTVLRFINDYDTYEKMLKKILKINNQCSCDNDH